MGGEVYADLLFLVNFSMDFLGFYLCARLLHRPLSLWRGVLASALGGVYAVAVLFLTVGKVPAFLLDALVCVALCAVAMAGRHERWKSLLRLCALYLLISVLLGGAMTLLYSQLNRIPGLTDQVAEDGLSAWLFFILAIISAVLTALWGRCFKRTTHKRVDVIIEQNGASVRLAGLCDSGNLLRDPISGKPVIPADTVHLAPLLPPPLLRAVKSDRVTEAIESMPSDVARSVRLIPARTALGERMMIAFAPERIYLCEVGRHDKRQVSALIAPTALTGKKDGIAALVPSELMI